MPKVFISHSSADKELADALFDLLQTGCDLSARDIFCSSIDGAGIKTGEDFVKWIDMELRHATLVLLIVTPNYFISKFCIAEMGAAWTLDKKVFPILLPEMDPEIGTVMLGRKTAKFDNSGLDELRDEIIAIFSNISQKTGRWNAKSKEFFNSLPEVIEALPPPKHIDQDVYELMVEERDAAQELYEEVAGKNKILEEKIKDLEKLKDREQVTEIMEKYADQETHYSELLKDVKNGLRGLESVVIRCLYALVKGNGWRPDPSGWDSYEKDIERARDSDWIEDSIQFEGLIANLRHPKVDKVNKSIQALGEYIDKNMEEQFLLNIEEEKGIIVSITNREYWDSQLLRYSMLD